MQVLMFCGFFSCCIIFSLAQHSKRGMENKTFFCIPSSQWFFLSVRKGCLFLQPTCYKEDGDRSKKEKKVGGEW
jgi:hypothetical protein